MPRRKTPSIEQTLIKGDTRPIWARAGDAATRLDALTKTERKAVLARLLERSVTSAARLSNIPIDEFMRFGGVGVKKLGFENFGDLLDFRTERIFTPPRI